MAIHDPIDLAWDALGDVYDPELCVDVVSLGLVYAVRRESATLVVEMTLTTPGCPASETLPEMARDAVARALRECAGDGDASEIEVRIVWDPPWNPSMMNDEAVDELGFRLE